MALAAFIRASSASISSLLAKALKMCAEDMPIIWFAS